MLEDRCDILERVGHVGMNECDMLEGWGGTGWESVFVTHPSSYRGPGCERLQHLKAILHSSSVSVQVFLF